MNASCEIDRSWMGLASSSGKVGTVSGKVLEFGLITCRIPRSIGVRPMRFGKKQADTVTHSDKVPTYVGAPNGPGKESLRTRSPHVTQTW